jgi:enoyl-CoA hydratase
MADYKYILTDRPSEHALRITLNRPEKRNALSNALRTEMFDALEAGDKDPNTRVMILRGAGPSFSAGYDLAGNPNDPRPFHTSAGMAHWPRHVIEGCMRMWDMGTPIIGQVHGFCLAGASELAAACDLLYCAEDAQIGYPPVRMMSPPDNQFHPWFMGMRRAMEMMLTGDSITGKQAADWGFANAALPIDKLEEHVLMMAERVSKIPPSLQQLNKRAVHRQMEAMGIRNGLRAGAEIQAIGFYTPEAMAYFGELRKSVTGALSKRDGEFGDYRTANKEKAGEKK